MERLLKNLKYIANRLFVIEEYEKFLDLAARFPNLNIYNLLLLYYQMPTATLVAGENAWKDNYNLEVKENEKAICLLRPSLDENEVLGYSQIGVFDVSQLNTIPEIKKEEFKIAYALHQATGCVCSYADPESEELLGDSDLLYMEEEAEIIIREPKEMDEIEKEKYSNRQFLKFYIENSFGLSQTEPKDLAIMQGASYILCKRYDLAAEIPNQAVLMNCKQEGIGYFIELLDFVNQIISGFENQIFVEFNFAETAFVDLLLDAEDDASNDFISDYAIEDNDTVLDKSRIDFIEKVDLLSSSDYHKMIEDRKNNKMMTQPPYRVKLIPDA